MHFLLQADPVLGESDQSVLHHWNSQILQQSEPYSRGLCRSLFGQGPEPGQFGQTAEEKSKQMFCTGISYLRDNVHRMNMKISLPCVFELMNNYKRIYFVKNLFQKRQTQTDLE
jgi:hypothetical protein